MLLSRIIPAAFAATVLASAGAYAQADQGAPPSQGEHQQGEHQPGPFHMLSPEQRMMLFVQMRDDTANMTDDQRYAYRHQQRDKFMAMSDSERQEFAQNLQAKWDALPAAKQADIKQQMEAFRAQRRAEREQMQPSESPSAPQQQ